MTDPTQPDKPEEITPSIPPPPPVFSSPYPGQQVSTGRPVLVTVVAVALFVFAAFAVVGIISNFGNLNAPPQPGVSIPSDVLINQIVLKAIAFLVYMVMGIGLIKLAPWARKGTIFSLLGLFILGVVFNFWMFTQIHVTPPPGSNVTPEFMQRMILIGVVGAEVVVAIGLTLIIVALTRHHVKAAFNEGP